jgi:hypothetical protein
MLGMMDASKRYAVHLEHTFQHGIMDAKGITKTIKGYIVYSLAE